jgi:hypothetical protein
MVAEACTLRAVLAALTLGGALAACGSTPASPERQVVNMGHACGKDEPVVIMTLKPGQKNIDVLCDD